MSIEKKALTARDGLDILRRHTELVHDWSNPRLCVVVHAPGTVGGTPVSDVIAMDGGFDWDSGKLMIRTAEPLTMLSPADVKAINESVRAGTSWHAYQKHKLYAQHIDALTAERDALREALQAAHDLLSDERLGQWRYMESGDFYDDANKVVLTARAALGRNHDE